VAGVAVRLLISGLRFATVIETLRVAVPPLPSLTETVTVYIPRVDGAVQVTVLPVPEIEPPVHVQEYVSVSSSGSLASQIKELTSPRAIEAG
jgi:hypothetical protein